MFKTYAVFIGISQTFNVFIIFSKLEYKDMSEEMLPRQIRNITSTVFGNNFGASTPLHSVKKPVPLPIPNTPTHSFIYFGKDRYVVSLG